MPANKFKQSSDHHHFMHTGGPTAVLSSVWKWFRWHGARCVENAPWYSCRSKVAFLPLKARRWSCYQSTQALLVLLMLPGGFRWENKSDSLPSSPFSTCEDIQSLTPNVHFFRYFAFNSCGFGWHKHGSDSCHNHRGRRRLCLLPIRILTGSLSIQDKAGRMDFSNASFAVLTHQTFTRLPYFSQIIDDPTFFLTTILQAGARHI